MRTSRFILTLIFSLLFAIGAGAQANGASGNRKPDPTALKDYVGRYEVDPNVAENFIFDVTLENNELWIKPSHIDKRKLLPQSRDDFLIAGVDLPLKFNRGEKGNVTSFTIQAPYLFDGRSVTPRKLALPSPSLKGNTTFKLKGYPDARVVALAGTFNNWNQSQLLFAREGDGWVCRIDLAPGKYEYKFIVDGNWITDLSNPTTEDDGKLK